MLNFIEKLKGAWRSKTVWVNSIFLTLLPFADQLVVAIAPVLQDLSASLPELQPYLPDNIYKFVGICMVCVNIFLRFKTRLPLDAK